MMFDGYTTLSEREAMIQEIQYLPDQIYFAARDGMVRIMCSLLENMPHDKVKELLSREMEDDNGQKCTPLIIAARNGHEKMVKVFINRFPVDLEQEGSVKVDSFLVDGASALWCAAGAGHINVVKALVHAGADINHATLTQSTPLRAACFDGRLDIVQYLVDHGADLHKLNKFNNSCLMIAAYKGHLEIVKYLLEKGANPDQKALCGATAMHFAAECGNLEIVKELLKHGAKMTRNEHGLTPLLAGAERTRLGIVEFLIKQDEVSLADKIDALELLGASFANDKDSYSLELAYVFLKRAMEYRYLDSNNVLQKPKFEPVAAYNNRQECQNMEELEIIKNNADELHMESLTIRERILGKHNPDVLHSVVFRGAVFADHSKFDRCIMLWLHALYLSQLNKISITKDLLRFSQVFSQMVSNRETIKFSYLETVLSAAVAELSRNKEKMQTVTTKDDIAMVQDEMESNLLSSLYIIGIVTKLKSKFIPDEEYRVHQLVHNLVNIHATSRHGQSLLHLCVDPDTPIDSFHIIEVCRYPCAETTKFLIKCGADVNAMDDFRNTPLHVIVCYQRSTNDFMTLHSIIIDLIDAGAHIDTVNASGKTPIEVATTGVAEIILRTQTKLNLKCLSAKIVQKYSIPYNGMVPKHLESFIRLHGVEKNDQRPNKFSETCVKDKRE
ncbi:protein fem-1 homolog B-like isoform X2 [Planococcus citri]|uniref:protein fem-1 homolog B-like isoform X2 n=1 Tax=Planococcus citri TaxID=170843 RepID=UPI0031F95EF8